MNYRKFRENWESILEIRGFQEILASEKSLRRSPYPDEHKEAVKTWMRNVASLACMYREIVREKFSAQPLPVSMEYLVTSCFVELQKNPTRWPVKNHTQMLSLTDETIEAWVEEQKQQSMSPFGEMGITKIEAQQFSLWCYGVGDNYDPSPLIGKICAYLGNSPDRHIWRRHKITPKNLEIVLRQRRGDNLPTTDVNDAKSHYRLYMKAIVEISDLPSFYKKILLPRIGIDEWDDEILQLAWRELLEEMQKMPLFVLGPYRDGSLER